MNKLSKWTLTGFGIAAILFFASGFSSLIYQVVWNRLFVFVFGSTTFATASVLAVFMGGLALGSYVAGRISTKVARPLLWYGILEGIIGLWALLLPSIIDVSVPLYKAAWLQFHPTPVVLGLQRFLLAAFCILLPTVCMGATLPLLSKFVSNNPKTIGFRVGTLYAINTFGAVFGAAMAGFMLLPTLGLALSTMIAAGINFVLLVAVVIASRVLEKPSAIGDKTDEASRTPITSEEIQESEAGAEPASGQSFGMATKVATAVFGISGALSMVYEVGWTKALVFVVGSSTFAFTCMLTTFLIGIFLGSLICARFIDKSRNPILVFAVLEMAIALLAVFGLFCYSYLPIANLILGGLLKPGPDLALTLKFIFSAATFVPLTLGLGATFPAVVRACAPDLKTVGRSVGVVYSANTCGAIVGAFVAGFFLVPWLGVEKMLVFAAIGNLALGVVLLFVSGSQATRFRVPALTGVAVATALALAVPVWDKTLLLFAQPLRRNTSLDQVAIAAALLDKDARDRVLGGARVLYFADGISSNVGVIEHSDPPHRAILTNGNIDGGDRGDMTTQLAGGTFSLFCRPEAKDVCVVGWGTGVTSGASTLFPETKVTSVELEEKVIEASKLFHHVNYKPEESPRHRLVINDGRNYLMVTEDRYDVITTEPSNQWQAGVCNLFTREYFQICKQRLNSGGILCCWLQTTEISPENVKGIISTLLSVFKHVTITTASGQTDVLFLASDEPVKFNYRWLEESYKNPLIKAAMQEAGAKTPDSLLISVIGGDKAARELAQGAPPNTDDRNYLEYSVCRTYESVRYTSQNSQMLHSVKFDPEETVDFTGVSKEERCRMAAQVALDALHMHREAAARNWASWAVSQGEHSKSVASSVATALAVLSRLESTRGNAVLAGSYADKALAGQADNAQATLAKAIALQSDAATKDSAAAISFFEKAVKLEPGNYDFRYQLASVIGDWKGISYDFGPPIIREPQKTLDVLAPVMSDSKFFEGHPDAMYLAGLCSYQIGKAPEALRLLRSYLKLNPDSISAQRTLGSLEWLNQAPAPASAWWTVSILQGRPIASKARRQAETFLRDKKLSDAYEETYRCLVSNPSNKDTLALLDKLSTDVKAAKALKNQVDDTTLATYAENPETERNAASSMAIARFAELFAGAYLLFLVIRKRRHPPGQSNDK